jgi:dTDP-4-dehydrorhamnose reductase
MVTLITGATGMLGNTLSAVLQKAGFEVVTQSFDIMLDSEVQRMLKKYSSIDAIVHCAAMTGVNACEEDKERCLATNVEGTKRVIAMARSWDAKVIFISTPMVFSGQAGNYSEESKPQPLNYYGHTKYLAEQEVLKYPQGLVIRVNPIGIRPASSDPSFIQWFVAAARTNQSFTLFQDVKINPISTTTLSSYILKLLTHFQSGILHIGSRDVVNKAEIWEMILAKFPYFSGTVTPATVDATSAGKIARRPKEMWLNVDKAKKLFTLPSWKQEVTTVLSELSL